LKRFLSVIIIFLLLSGSVIPVLGLSINKSSSINNRISKNRNYKKINDLFTNEEIISSGFDPIPIDLEDDAFHGAESLNFAEWWYFDAEFENDYHVQATVYVFDILYQKFIVVNVNIYRDMINVLSRDDIYLFSEMFISEDSPYIEIDGKEVMRGYIDEVTGEWVYNINVEVEDAIINLTFRDDSQGWMGNLPIGGWTVALPNAKVSGRINLFENEIECIGKGYHDHNWDMNIFDLLNFGWYWGRIKTDGYTIVWFMVMNTRMKSQDLVIISKDGGEFYNIDSNNIDFIASEYKLDMIWWIPNRFVLEVDESGISMFISLSTNKLDSMTTPGLGHYWRYHTNSQGYININDDKKDISGIQIAELFRYR
jgi:hypothetical protein